MASPASINRSPESQPEAEAIQESRRSATSEKLNFLDAVRVDPDIGPVAKLVAAEIMKHVNQRSGAAMVSTRTLSDGISMSEATVARALRELKGRWFTWRRTRSANVYSPIPDRVSEMLDLRIHRRDIRQEERRSRSQWKDDIFG